MKEYIVNVILSFKWLFSGLGGGIVVFLLSYFFIHRRKKHIPTFKGNLEKEYHRKALSGFLEKNIRKIIALDIWGIDYLDRYTPPAIINFVNDGNYDSLTITNYGSDFHFLDGHLMITIKITNYETHQGLQFGAIAVASN